MTDVHFTLHVTSEVCVRVYGSVNAYYAWNDVEVRGRQNAMMSAQRLNCIMGGCINIKGGAERAINALCESRPRNLHIRAIDLPPAFV